MIRSTGKMAVGDKVSGRWPAVSRFVRVLAPVLLFLWPFVGIRQGVDIGDTTYALANYVYIDRIDPMWLLATWLPNVCGSLITHLPGGGSLFGVRLWCTPVICATALIAWFATERLFRDKEGGTPVLFLVRFAGIWIAEGLCWCPVVILYNYLTYLFLTLASVFLLFGFARTLSDDTLTLRRGGWYLAAGICLGLNLFVRFPNIVEVLLILAVWFHEGRIAAKKQGLSAAGILARCAKATGICVLGFIPGVIIPLVIISIRYGFDAYPRMIAGLFSMTEGASDYTLSGMLFDTLRAYTASAVEML
ncbi:MAG: hypothetical protein K6G16_03575, partial [Lachnospiraceae bacterium]|nr:hypothetical protein [Lachnospiraceae bacterium]